jgi:uncharacterized damage-inducible protein DinB
MASYNQWMNAKLYATTATLSSDKIVEDSGAFFGSILGTLNHILIADTAWLKRFSHHAHSFASLSQVADLPIPTRLDEILHNDFAQLTIARQLLDDTIIHFCDELTEDILLQPLTYNNMKGQRFTKPFHFLLQHFFNHQTHHRGQTTTLLFQKGVDVGVTDLLAITPDIEH